MQVGFDLYTERRRGLWVTKCQYSCLQCKCIKHEFCVNPTGMYGYVHSSLVAEVCVLCHLIEEKLFHGICSITRDDAAIVEGT